MAHRAETAPNPEPYWLPGDALATFRAGGEGVIRSIVPTNTLSPALEPRPQADRLQSGRPRSLSP